MTIRFLLLVNKQGQTRLATYNEIVPLEERRQIEGEIVRKCLTRSEMQCSFLEHRGLKVIYRRYASLYFVVGVDDQENELAIYEFIHCVVETLDRHFGNVCELDIIFNFHKAYYILDELFIGGNLQETSKKEVLKVCAQQDDMMEETEPGKKKKIST